MKVIFLDIDGVLNVIGQGYDEFGQIFHKHLEENLKKIVDSTGAKIVISSTWRYAGLKKMQKMWTKRNLAGEVIDITDDLGIQGQRIKRGFEIQKWLQEHPEVIQYVILDDDTDMLNHQIGNFVRTSNNTNHFDCIDIGYGLTTICAEKAIRILNKLL